MDVETFCMRHLRRRWRLGSVDCCLVLADWSVEGLGTEDPAVHLRGSYDDEAGYLALFAKAGGAVELVDATMSRVRFRRVQEPIAGSIAVIGSRFNPAKQWGAIFDGRHWRVRMADSFPAVTASALALWTR